MKTTQNSVIANARLCGKAVNATALTDNKVSPGFRVISLESIMANVDGFLRDLDFTRITMGSALKGLSQYNIACSCQFRTRKSSTCSDSPHSAYFVNPFGKVFKQRPHSISIDWYNWLGISSSTTRRCDFFSSNCAIRKSCEVRYGRRDCWPRTKRRPPNLFHISDQKKAVSPWAASPYQWHTLYCLKNSCRSPSRFSPKLGLLLFLIYTSHLRAYRKQLQMYYACPTCE